MRDKSCINFEEYFKTFHPRNGFIQAWNIKMVLFFSYVNNQEIIGDAGNVCKV